MEPIVIKLTVPLTHGAETITELRITRRPTAGDLRGVKISELTFDDIITVASRLVALPPSVLNTMDLSDFTELSGVIGAFFGSGQPTGMTLRPCWPGCTTGPPRSWSG